MLKATWARINARHSPPGTVRLRRANDNPAARTPLERVVLAMGEAARTASPAPLERVLAELIGSAGAGGETPPAEAP